MQSKDSWEDEEDSWENQDVNDLAENLQQLSVDTKKATTNNNNKTSSSAYTPKSVKGRGELKYRRYEKEKAEEEEYEASQNSEKLSKSKSTDQTQALKSIPHIDHILEMYDFATNSTVADLEKLLLPYKSFGFRVELVDSTHALVSFNTPSVAKDALRTLKRGAKLRSIYDASLQSQQTIIKQKGMASPSKQAAYDHEIAEWEGNGSVGRPATSDRVARRMIANALQMPELVRSPKSSEPQPSRQKTEKKDYWND